MSYWRALGIETTQSPRPDAGQWVVSFDLVCLEHGILAIEFNRTIDPSGVTWSKSCQRRWEFHDDPVDDSPWDLIPPPKFKYDTSPFWNRWGLGRLSGGSFASTSVFGIDAFFVPVWLLLAAWLLPLLLWQSRRAVQRRRARRGLCPRCGYDLRASPKHCPECGTPAPGRMEVAA